MASEIDDSMIPANPAISVLSLQCRGIDEKARPVFSQAEAVTAIIP